MLVKVNMTGVGAIGVDKAGSHLSSESRAGVGLGDALDQLGETDLLEKGKREDLAEHSGTELLVGEEIGGLELLGKLVECGTELGRDGGSRLASFDVLAPDGIELSTGVAANDGLDIADVGEVEVGGLAILEEHRLDVLGVLE